jgi:hypothetical protein
MIKIFKQFNNVNWKNCKFFQPNVLNNLNDRYLARVEIFRLKNFGNVK